MPTVGDPDGRSSEQVDAAFAEIVAGFDTPIEPDKASWHASEDVPVESVGTTPATGPIWPAGGPILNHDPRADPHGPSLLEGLDTFGADLPDDGQPFVRPEPQPLPRISAPAVFGALITVFGVFMIIKGNLLPSVGSSANLLAGVTVTVAGVALLISRLRPGGDDEPELPDDGAVV
ncbi:hypothetical protein F4553_002819 [Allocatelliglobosispora scoriae]|uniref:DUF308 domain-containing protein n=1 Tax=Allocatelliglobosispora scoriae TaxID=643052 RepID=A0A841BRL1_9ACTN|nr:hypothetical protein [Allocatelliglobosispora scoriae]MBB5869440.1 hypothetical protein [Allocatelliglobosispora scoriae]